MEQSVVNGGNWGRGVCLYLCQYSNTSGGNPSSNVGLSTKMTGANKSSEVSQVKVSTCTGA